MTDSLGDSASSAPPPTVDAAPISAPTIQVPVEDEEKRPMKRMLHHSSGRHGFQPAELKKPSITKLEAPKKE